MSLSQYFRLNIVVILTLLLADSAWCSLFRERERTYDVLHYTLDIRIDELQQTVGGTVGLRLVPLKTLNEVAIDAARMTIRSVQIAGKQGEPLEAKFSTGNDKLVVTLPHTMNSSDTFTVLVSYNCSPRSGMYFVAPDDGYPDKPYQVWTQGEPEENHLWFPCYDYPNDKSTCEILVTVNEKLQVISNGALLEVTDHPEEKTKTYHWFCAKPIASYQMSVVVGKYATVREWYKNIPVEYNVAPARLNDVQRSFSRTIDMMKFFSEKLRFDYPWSKYAQTVVTDFIWGGMENTSATTLNERTLHSERAHLDVSSDNLVAHELAHQWFGDLLTCRNWSHAWLNEGFATYFTNLWIEHDKGRDQFLFDMAETQFGVRGADFGASRKPTVTDVYAEPADLFGSRIYGRGACILHMLRGMLGEDVFWSGIQRYIDLNQYRSVTTDDLRHAMEAAAKVDLSWFFNQWVTKAGFPMLDVSSEYNADTKKLLIHVRQSQQVDELTPLYRLPIEIAVDTKSGRKLHRIVIEPQQEQMIELPSDEPPLNIVIDPESWVLKAVNQSKSLEEWLYQLMHGGSVERSSALRALSSNPDSAGIKEAIAQALVNDPLWAIRREAVLALGQGKNNGLVQMLEPAFNDPDSRVRVAATGVLQNLKTLDALVALGNILESDSSYDVAARAIGALVSIDSVHGMQYCEKGLSMESHNDGVKAAATRTLGTLRTDEAKEKLFSLTTYGQPREVRIAAIDALAGNWRDDADVRERIEELTTDKLHHVRRKAIERLAAVGNSDSRPILQAVLDREPDTLLRREARSALETMNKRLRQ